MKIGHGSISGIQGLRNLETEEILSFNPLIPNPDKPELNIED
jgi:hypothetical protein